MSQGPENTFIDSVHKHLPAYVYRMKNHNAYVGGVPDMWYSGSVSDLWVEYKFIEVPRCGATLIDLTSGKRPTLSHLQQNWLRSRHEEGRKVGVVVGSKIGGVWFEGVDWERPLSAVAFTQACFSRSALAQTIETVCCG